MVTRSRILLIVLSFFFVLFSLKLYRVYDDHFASFGCFDECYNYVSGYFILKGRQLYSQIYFNHQMLAGYISAFLQYVLHPQSIYFLVLEHRFFVFFFGILMDLLLIARFGLPAIAFALIFEATKFYFMGSLFIAESFLIYPLVYLFGIAWQKVLEKKVFVFDYLISGAFTWFVIFLREPAILSAVFLYGIILWGKTLIKVKLMSVFIFLLLTILILFPISLSDYLKQVFLYNVPALFLPEIKSQAILGVGIFKVFFYPIFILTSGEWTFMREILILLDVLFLFSLTTFVVKTKKIKSALILLFALGLMNFRIVSPGKMFYEAFHLLPWYGLFIFFTFLLVRDVFVLQKRRIIKYGIITVSIVIFFYAVSPRSFIWEKIGREGEFRLNFDTYYIYGQAIKELSKKSNLFYSEGWNELIIWQTNLDSGYKYGRGVGNNNVGLEFIDARFSMFKNNPPDFYYSFCLGKTRHFGFLPDYLINDYIELNYIDKPSCLFIKKSKLSEISKKQWENVNVLRFYLPESNSL